MAAMDVDEEEDYVVKEIPVFLSQQLADTLYLLQYPNRRQRVEAPLAARFKPNGRRFEMDIPLEVSGRHYSTEKGEELGAGMNEEALLTAMDIDKINRERKPLDKILLSSHILPQAHSFFVGAVQDEEFHVTSLNAMVQMRPSLKYKDKIAEKERALTQRLQSDEAQIKKPAGEEDAKVIQRRVIQSDDKDNLRRVKQGQEETVYGNEEWTPMEFYNNKTFESNKQYERLFSMGDDLHHELSRMEYLDAICPSEAGPKASKLDSGLLEKLKLMFLNAHVMQYKRVREVFNIPDDVLIAELEKICVLVRGVWIIRSEHIYTGRLADVRRQILYMLNTSESGAIKRTDFTSAANLPHLMATNLIGEIGYFMPKVGWQLKLPPDEDFCAKYPNVVSRQKETVALEASNPQAIFEAQAKKEDVRRVNAPSSAAGAVQKTVSKDKGISSAPVATPKYTIPSGSLDVQLSKLLKELLTKYGVCSGDFLVKTIQHAYGDGEGPSSEEIMSAINLHCVLLQGRYALQKLGVPKTDKFREPILALFKTKSAVKKSEVTSACQLALGEPPTQTMYTSIMKEVALSSGPSWELKKSPAFVEG